MGTFPRKKNICIDDWAILDNPSQSGFYGGGTGIKGRVT
jgi:hypothetical protein